MSDESQTVETSTGLPFPHAQLSSAPPHLLRWHKRMSVRRYLRLVERLSHMSPAEIGTRLWRPVRKGLHSLCHRYGITWGTSSQQCREAFLHRLQTESGGTALNLHIREHLDRRFFFGPADRHVMCDQVVTHFPGIEQRTQHLADELAQPGLILLGQRVKLVPGEIDWQADPCTGWRLWSAGVLDEGEAVRNQAADVKYVWEVNRHQYLPLLGRAFWLTGEDRYARDAVALVQDWLTHNPVGLGVNWCSHLEVAVRAMSWLWTLPYLLAWDDLEPEFLNQWLGSLAEHYHHLSGHLSVYTDPTNHLLGEATALWMLSLIFPELPGASRQQQRARDVLLRGAKVQVMSDGVNAEQATSYHRFVLDFYLQFYILAKRSGDRLPESFTQRLIAMLDFAAALAGVSGAAPMIGDSDDARGVPFIEGVGWDFRDVLSTGAQLFDRPDWQRLSGGGAELTTWLLGPEGPNPSGGVSHCLQERRSQVFPEGGYGFLRATQASDDVELIFDVGPLGLKPHAAHGHADALSLLVRVNGQFLLTDPGTGAYFHSPHVRDVFRRTAAHNTITVDGLDQADLFDTFKWVNPMSVRLSASHLSEHFDYLRAEHSGYRRLYAPVTHTRAVLFVRPDEWIVVDELEGEGRHEFVQSFHFPPNVLVQQPTPYDVVVQDKETGYGVQLSIAPVEAATVQVDDGSGWSERYGHWQAASRLRVALTAEPPQTFVTFIRPLMRPLVWSDGDRVSRCHVTTFGDGRATLCRRVPAGSEGVETWVLVNPLQQALDLPHGWRSNAAFLFVEKRLDEDVVERVFMAEADSTFAAGTMHWQCTVAEPYVGAILPASSVRG